LVRVLQAQSRRRVGLVDHSVVRKGADAIRVQLAELEHEGIGVAIVDAIDNDDLFRLAAAIAGRPLVTAGSGLAIGLPANFGLAASNRASALPLPRGRRAIIAGSCSVATQRQVRAFVERGGRAFAIEPLQLNGGDIVGDVIAWSARQPVGETLLVSSTAAADAVAAVQSRLGVERAGALVEHALAAIARGLVEQGIGQLVVAGGETSGACVEALGIASLRIGPQIDPGVPWCHAESHVAGGGLHLALKSGNFGTDDFFTRAFEVL
jgi:3-dehydrotetronate 4-kinase